MKKQLICFLSCALVSGSSLLSMQLAKSGELKVEHAELKKSSELKRSLPKLIAAPKDKIAHKDFDKSSSSSSEYCDSPCGSGRMYLDRSQGRCSTRYAPWAPFY